MRGGTIFWLIALRVAEGKEVRMCDIGDESKGGVETKDDAGEGKYAADDGVAMLMVEDDATEDGNASDKGG